MSILTGHSDAINVLAYNYCGSILVSASDDKTARVWSQDAKSCLRIIELSTPCVAACWHPHQPKEVMAWFVDCFLSLHQIEEAAEDDEFLIAESAGLIHLHSLEAGRALSCLQSTAAPLVDVDWCASDPRKFVGYARGCLLVWDRERSGLPSSLRDLGSETAGLARLVMLENVR